MRSNIVTSFASLVLVAFAGLACGACGGSAVHEAKGPEKDPWAGYKGTYAESASPHPKSSSAKGETPKTETAKAESPKAESPKTDLKAKAAEPADDASATASSGPKKPSKGSIRGESVSSIGLDALVDASKSAIKGKLVTTKYVVGPQYEQIQVQLKGGDVQIIRPASTPAPDGPAISSPKSRNVELSKTESGWYDADADVLVVVNAGGKKAGAQKLLGTILKR